MSHTKSSKFKLITSNICLYLISCLFLGSKVVSRGSLKQQEADIAGKGEAEPGVSNSYQSTVRYLQENSPQRQFVINQLKAKPFKIKLIQHHSNNLVTRELLEEGENFEKDIEVIAKIVTSIENTFDERKIKNGINQINSTKNELRQRQQADQNQPAPRNSQRASHASFAAPIRVFAGIEPKTMVQTKRRPMTSSKTQSWLTLKRQRQLDTVFSADKSLYRNSSDDAGGDTRPQTSQQQHATQ